MAAMSTSMKGAMATAMAMVAMVGAMAMAMAIECTTMTQWRRQGLQWKAQW